jgi:hypothetical protein
MMRADYGANPWGLLLRAGLYREKTAGLPASHFTNIDMNEIAIEPNAAGLKLQGCL